MSFYANYPVEGGGSGGGVTTLNGLSGALTLVGTGGITITPGVPGASDITIDGSGIVPVGAPDTFAGFDDSGNLYSVPGYLFDPTTFGYNIGLTVPYSGGASYNLNNNSFNLVPSVDSPNTNVDLKNMTIEVDPTSTGFTIGTNGQALNAYNTFIQHHGTSNTGLMSFFNNYADLGNGTDVIQVNGLTYYSAFGDINANTEILGQIQGYGFNVNVHAGATLGQDIRPFFDNSNISISVPGHESFSSSPNISSIDTNHNMNAFSAQGSYTTFAGSAGYFGLSIDPNIGTMNTGQFVGISINPTITTANTAGVSGININMSGVTGGTGDPPFTFNGQNGRFSNQANATSNQSGNNIISQLDTSVSPLPGGEFQLNNIGGSFTVAAGFPVSNSFGFGNNLGTSVIIQDDMGPDPATGTLGFSLNGFVNQLVVATGKTMDTLNYMLAGGSIPNLGQGVGTITNVNMFSALGLISAGGSATITNMVGFHVQDTLTGLSPTNAWGIRVDDVNADNWFAKNVVIGGNTMHPSGADALEVTGSANVHISVTDSGASAGIFAATSNTTVNGSNTTLGINGVATATVQVGAENDKEVGGMNFSVTRGDGTDAGILDAMIGSNVLLFHNSDTAGVTDNVYGMSTLFFSIQGTATNLYDFFSQRVPAGSGVVTNHYGVYISDDSATPVKNWLSGSTQMGGSSFSPAASTILDLQSTTGALLVPRMSTSDKTGLTASNGMIVYDTSLNELDGYINGAWTSLSGGGGGGGASSGAKITIPTQTGFSGGPALVNFTNANADYDTGTYTATANEFIAPSAGIYTLAIHMVSATNNPADFIGGFYAVNGGSPILFTSTNFGAPGVNANTVGVTDLQLSPSDTVTLYAFSSNGDVNSGEISFHLNSGSGSSGANQALSNLTSPTAINQNLYSLTGGSWTIGTFDAVTADLNISTNANGIAAGVNSGAVVIATQAATTTGTSGATLMTTGGTVDAASGIVAIGTGAVSGVGTSGGLNFSTGDNSGDGNTGGFVLGTGASSGPSGVSGPIDMYTGGVAANTSGHVTLATGPGTAADANSGTVSISTGLATGVGQSGGLTIVTGTTDNNSSGALSLSTGASSSNVSGDISISTGSAAGTRGGMVLDSHLTTISVGTAGNLRLTDTTEGTAGAIWTSVDTNGGGSWVGPGASGSFTTVDAKTVTVVNGIITSIV